MPQGSSLATAPPNALLKESTAGQVESGEAKPLSAGSQNAKYEALADVAGMREEFFPARWGTFLTVLRTVAVVLFITALVLAAIPMTLHRLPCTPHGCPWEAQVMPLLKYFVALVLLLPICVGLGLPIGVTLVPPPLRSQKQSWRLRFHRRGRSDVTYSLGDLSGVIEYGPQDQVWSASGRGMMTSAPAWCVVFNKKPGDCFVLSLLAHSAFLDRLKDICQSSSTPLIEHNPAHGIYRMNGAGRACARRCALRQPAAVNV